MATKFNDKKCAALDKKWSEYRDRIMEERYDQDDTETYKELMIDTFPIIYEAWNKDVKTVDKDAARLLTTLGNLFNPLYDDEYNFLGSDDLETYALFHGAFLDALIYERLSFDDDGNIVVETDDTEYIVNPKTFDVEENDEVDEDDYEVDEDDYE